MRKGLTGVDPTINKQGEIGWDWYELEEEEEIEDEQQRDAGPCLFALVVEVG